MFSKSAAILVKWKFKVIDQLDITHHFSSMRVAELHVTDFSSMLRIKKFFPSLIRTALNFQIQ